MPGWHGQLASSIVPWEWRKRKYGNMREMAERTDTAGTPRTDLCMVVHGPEPFDCGDVAWLQSHVQPGRTIVAGVMARTAAEESGLSCEFGNLPPSIVIRGLDCRTFLVNRAKTDESGRIFGEIVASRLGDAGLVHLECTSGIIYLWNAGDRILAEDLSELTGYPVIPAVASPRPVTADRTIRGCLPGEPVYINGLVIGHATGDEVVLGMRNGHLIPLSGLVPKPHGLEKVARTHTGDITRAWCKSGGIRTAPPASTRRTTCQTGVVLMIDHCGHEIYRLLHAGVCGVVSVGDDTTGVCGHITTHRGIPVFGIVDGDEDAIVQPSFAPGSVVVHVLEGRDDDLGREIAQYIDGNTVYWPSFVENLLAVLGSRVRVVHDTRTIR